LTAWQKEIHPQREARRQTQVAKEPTQAKSKATRWETDSNYQYVLLVAFDSLLTISSTFDLLFKVLFTFPSLYFFAIGFPDIFSFG